MRSVYERANLIITKFDTEDVITTSGPSPYIPPVITKREIENAYVDFNSFVQAPGTWFDD